MLLGGRIGEGAVFVVTIRMVSMVVRNLFELGVRGKLQIGAMTGVLMGGEVSAMGVSKVVVAVVGVAGLVSKPPGGIAHLMVAVILTRVLGGSNKLIRS
ncbi:hypothetical protein GUJ93_ZPchr0006g44863 [Zizania palustris]|uniref:Uncharacterized protein n=1 Tax=Zizania palustris TaxID=103762 RepID=A0A8J5SLT5_ZIZPA|nr:hypothetical protein GUJ93_ZPchr0006g44863 [Zizania palustris]